MAENAPLITVTLDAPGPVRSRDEVLRDAAAAVARIDLHHRRGLTGLSLADIEAMALALVILWPKAPPEFAPSPEPEGDAL